MRHFLHELFCCYTASQDNSTFSLLKNLPYFYIFACHIHNLVYLLLLHYIKLIKRIVFSYLVWFFNFHPFFYRFFFSIFIFLPVFYSIFYFLFIFSEISYCFGYQMAPSTGKSPMGTQTSSGSQKISTEILVGWPPQNAPPKVSYHIHYSF